MFLVRQTAGSVKPSLPFAPSTASPVLFLQRLMGIPQTTTELRFLLFPPALFSPSSCVFCACSCVTHLVCLCTENLMSSPSCPFSSNSEGNVLWNSLISLLPRCLDSVKHKGEVAGGAGREFAVHVAHPAVSSDETTKKCKSSPVIQIWGGLMPLSFSISWKD